MSAVPPHAVLIWADNVNIYCAPQATPDAVISFSRSEMGLIKAIGLLGAEHLEKAKGDPYVRPQMVPRKLALEGITPVDLAKARATLVELGIIK